MKQKLLTTICALLFIAFANAQVPQGINYQAIARNSSGAVLANQHISARFTINGGINGGNIVYQETDTFTTNTFGLFSHVIGRGTVVIGNFAGIAWNASNKFLLVELDAAAGTAFINMGSTQLVSVPYALSAATSADNKWAAADTNIYNLNSGFVGIGTQVPTAKLHLSRAGYAGIKLDNTRDSVKFEIGTPEPSSGSTGGIGTVSAHPLAFFANGADRMIIDTNGNVGIGSSHPGYKLDIIGGDGPRFRIFSQDDFYTGIITKNNTHEFFIGLQSASDAAGGLYSGFQIFDNTIGAQRMVIEADGRMGINNTAPAAQLDIIGDIKITDGTQGDGKVLTSDANGLASWRTGSGYGFRAENTANQALSPSTFTTVNFSQEAFDDGANYNPVTGKYRAPEAGVYHFNTVFALSPGATGNSVYGYISVNGTAVQGCGQVIAANNHFVVSLAIDLKLNAGDFVNVTGFSFTNGNTVWQGAGTGNFSGHKVY